MNDIANIGIELLVKFTKSKTVFQNDKFKSIFYSYRV